MLSLTRKTDYALVALAYLARQQHGEAGPASARQIADLFQLPQPLLMNIMKQLAAAGIVSATRGVYGGYVLARPPGDVSVIDVIEAIEGPVAFTACCCDTPGSSDTQEGSRRPDECRLSEVCPIRSPMQTVGRRIGEMLADMTLDDLLESPEAEKLVRITVK